VRVHLLSTLFIIPVFLFCVGCGGSSNSSNSTIPVFTNASLTGAYTFSTQGVNATGPFTLEATFSADGNGLISNGHTFYTTFNGITTGSFGNQAMTGTYLVSPAGQVVLDLDTQIVGPLTVNVVLTSSQHGELVSFQTATTASGSLDKQAPSAFGQTSIAGTYVFNVRGVDSGGLPEASVGVFTVDASGNIVGGTQDVNDNGVIRSDSVITAGPTSVMELLPDLGRGGVQFVSSTEGLQDFSCVVLDANHFKLMGFNGTLAGDAYRVTDTSVPTAMAFTMIGKANGSEAVEGGIVHTDGAGNILNTSVVDLNTGGIIGNSNVTGTYALTGNRVTMSLNSLNLVGYPSSGGMQLLTLDSQKVATGVAYAQTGPFSDGSLSGSYGVGISGGTTNGELDAVAQLTGTNGGSLAGSLSSNEAGTLTSNAAVIANYATDASGRGAGTLIVNGNTQHVEFYTVDSSRILFIETDSQVVIQGMLVKQTVQ
jgi:hypothetical protein